MRNMSAIAVIQKHIKYHLRSRILDEQDQAVICSETSMNFFFSPFWFQKFDFFVFESKINIWTCNYYCRKSRLAGMEVFKFNR